MSIMVGRVFLRICVFCELSVSFDVGRRALRRTTPRRCRRRNAFTVTHNPFFINYFFLSQPSLMIHFQKYESPRKALPYVWPHLNTRYKT